MQGMILESSPGDVEWLQPTVQQLSLSQMGAFWLFMTTVRFRKMQKCQEKKIGECSLKDEKKTQNESA